MRPTTIDKEGIYRGGQYVCQLLGGWSGSENSGGTYNAIRQADSIEDIPIQTHHKRGEHRVQDDGQEDLAVDGALDEAEDQRPSTCSGRVSILPSWIIIGEGRKATVGAFSA